MIFFEATLTLLAFAVILTSLATKAAIPYPSILVLGGLALSFVPGLPMFTLDPPLIFALFLPPLLLDAAYYTSWRDFKANWRQISGLAIGLVVASLLVTAFIAHLIIPDMPWAVAIVLGAIVAPTDAAAATTVMRRVRLPKRIQTIVEGESLINDATSLVFYKFGVIAVVAGSFSITSATMTLITVTIGSTILGIAISWCWVWLSHNVVDTFISILRGFLIVYGTYLIAEHLHLSGVIAVVAEGLYFGWRAPETISPQIRVSGTAIWNMVVFLLNALGFVLIGLQLPVILADLDAYSLKQLIMDALAIIASVVAIRFAWVMGVNTLLRIKNHYRPPHLPAHLTLPTWQGAIVVSWSGMRGLISIIAALAIPEITQNGQPFPYRELILFLAFCVVLATLVVQGLTLSGIIRKLGLGDDGTVDNEEHIARQEAASAAIQAIERLSETPGLPTDILNSLREKYEARLALASHSDETMDMANCTNEDFRSLAKLTALSAERDAILRLRREKIIGDETVHHLQQELDLVELTIKKPRHGIKISWLFPTTTPAS